MATGDSQTKKQAKPAEPRPQKHMIESRQMEQRRLPEGSSSEFLIAQGRQQPFG